MVELTHEGPVPANRTLDERSRRGEINGMSKKSRRKYLLPKTNYALWTVLLFVGAVLYLFSLLWPIMALSPAWAAYPFAICGIAIILWTLKYIWAGTASRARRV